MKESRNIACGIINGCSSYFVVVVVVRPFFLFLCVFICFCPSPPLRILVGTHPPANVSSKVLVEKADTKVRQRFENMEAETKAARRLCFYGPQRVEKE